MNPWARVRRPAKRRDEETGLELGFRSGLEDAVYAQLKAKGVAVSYEERVIPFFPEVKEHHYSPDFFLPNGIIIETKGRFVTKDRQKHLAVQKQHPRLDIRFVFSNPNERISKASKTTYAMWCEKYGFKYATKTVPDEWLSEPPNQESLEAISKLKLKPRKEKPPCNTDETPSSS